MEREEKKAMHARFNELLNEQKVRRRFELQLINNKMVQSLISLSGEFLSVIFMK